MGPDKFGKTYVIKEFGKRYYKNTIYVNFQTNKEFLNMVGENIEPKYLIEKLELYFGEKIVTNETLIFFDEIQDNERALTSLKYFYENVPDINIIAAGSLLGVALNRDKYSFPVGKVQMINMYPLSFKEFLIAVNRKILIEKIEKCFETNEKMDKDIHELCLELYRTYLLVGGMPEVVKEYLEQFKVISCIDIQTQIVESYKQDMTKYANNSESNKIISTFNSIPMQLAKENQKFQYKIVQKGGTSSIFGESILWLNNGGIINQVYKATPQLPLEMYKDLTSFKIYLCDVGLLINLAKYPLYLVDLKDEMNLISIGPLTENYVANELRINGFERYYWESNGRAELDFLIQAKNGIIPIEVKSNTNVKSRSLDLYMKLNKPNYAIRISSKNFGFSNDIKSVPLYAVFCIK